MVTMKGKRILGLVCLILMVISTRGGQALAVKNYSLADPLRIVHSRETPPLSFIGLNGEPKGIVIDYWRAWSLRNKVPVEFILTDWPSTLTMMQNGEADVHGGLYYNVERDAFLDYAEPYFDLQAAIFVRNGLDIAQVEDIGKRPVAVLDAGYSEFFLRKNYPDLHLKRYKSSKEMVAAAVAGEVDALLTEFTTLVHQLGALAKINEFSPIKTLYSHSLRAAVAEGNDSLLTMVKRGEENLTEREKERVFSRWIIEPPASFPWWTPLIVVVSLLIAAVGLFVWKRSG